MNTCAKSGGLILCYHISEALLVGTVCTQLGLDGVGGFVDLGCVGGVTEDH